MKKTPAEVTGLNSSIPLAVAPAGFWGGFGLLRGVERFPELGVLPHAVAVATNGDDVAAVDESVDQGGSHDVVTEDITLFLEAFVRGEDRGSLLVVGLLAPVLLDFKPT